MSIRQNSPSKNLYKYGQAQTVIQIMLAVQGALFCVAAAVMDDPVMSADDYGHIITSVKAEFWSWPIFMASLVYLLGIMINGNWRWSPALRLAGATTHVITLALFSFFGFGVNAIDGFVTMCGIGAAVNVWFFALNGGDLLRAILRGSK